MSDYSFDNAWHEARHRLTELEAWLDPATRRHLSDRGLGAGRSCLEVGAGGGSVAAWMAEHVGPTGRVLATDIDPRFAAEHAGPVLEVREHDVSRDPLPAGEFDLAHCRLVLAHLAGRERALAAMVAALRPGGWVVVEEMDFAAVTADDRHPGAAAFDTAVRAHLDVLRDQGFDPGYGRRLVGELRAQGLSEIGTEGHARICAGGSPGAHAWRLTFEQLRPAMLARGADPADVDRAVALCADPEFTFVSQVTMAAWGRRV